MRRCVTKDGWNILVGVLELSADSHDRGVGDPGGQVYDSGFSKGLLCCLLSNACGNGSSGSSFEVVFQQAG